MTSNLYGKLFRILFILCTSMLLLLLLKYTFIYIYPFVIILGLASLLHPLVSYIETIWKLSRALATFLIMGIFFSMLILSSYLLFTKIIKETTVLLETLPERMQQVKSMILSLFNHLYHDILHYFPILDGWHIDKNISTWLDKLADISIHFLSSIMLTTTEFINSIFYIGFVTIFIIIAVYIVTKDYTLLLSTCKHLLPIKLLVLLQSLWKNATYAFTGLIKAQVILTFLSTILIGIGLFLFHTDHLIIIILLIFIIDFIPYLGIGIIFIPWILYSFLVNDYTATLQLSVLYAFIIIFRQVIEPKLIANKIGVHPFIALSILFLGIQAFGVMGLFITPLCLIIISASYRTGIFDLLWRFIQGNS